MTGAWTVEHVPGYYPDERPDTYGMGDAYPPNGEVAPYSEAVPTPAGSATNDIVVAELEFTGAGVVEVNDLSCEGSLGSDGDRREIRAVRSEMNVPEDQW